MWPTRGAGHAAHEWCVDEAVSKRPPPPTARDRRYHLPPPLRMLPARFFRPLGAAREQERGARDEGACAAVQDSDGENEAFLASAPIPRTGPRVAGLTPCQLHRPVGEAPC